MKRTTISLPEDLAPRLQREARRHGPRQDLGRGQARRFPDGAAHEVRADDQPEDGKALGLAIPQSLPGRTDEVIQWRARTSSPAYSRMVNWCDLRGIRTNSEPSGARSTGTLPEFP